jgi:hypothetical protein
MTPEETGAVLATCALYDNRRTDPRTVIMWHRAIGDLPYQDCEAAVVAHYAESTDWIMPAHVRNRVKAARRDRLERAPVAPPPAELADEPGRYRAALQAGIKRIADGRSVLRAIGPLPGETPPPVAEVRKALGPALPPPERALAPEEIARRQVIQSRAARGELPAGQDPEGRAS